MAVMIGGFVVGQGRPKARYSDFGIETFTCSVEWSRNRAFRHSPLEQMWGDNLTDDSAGGLLATTMLHGMEH